MSIKRTRIVDLTRTVDEKAGLVVSIPISLYRVVISVFLPPRCRFYPSCSQYAITALRRHGLLRGSWLATRRIFRCHPFNPGGYDPVPER